MFEDPENLQTLCKPCNTLKGAVLDGNNPRTYPLMMKMIERWAFNYRVVRPRRVYAFRNLPVKHHTTVYQFKAMTHTEQLQNIYRKQKGLV